MVQEKLKSALDIRHEKDNGHKNLNLTSILNMEKTMAQEKLKPSFDLRHGIVGKMIKGPSLFANF